MKPKYFKMVDGVKTLIDITNAQELGLVEQYQEFLEAHTPYERAWRNRELDKTDWMLVADATYGGEPLAGSQKQQDIMDYRTALRDYNLTTDDRPERPEWFTE